MSLTYPWLRDYNYATDYFSTVYTYYNESFPAYPVNYYSLDHENTIWENTKILGGSYEKAGVGTLSGVVWKKIYMVPIFGLEELAPSTSNDEKGQTYYDSMTTTINIPVSYGIKPGELDVIDTNFGFSANSPKVKPLFMITNVNLSHQGTDNQMYQCKARVAPFDLTQLEKQINYYYLFLNSKHEIYPISKGTFLLTLERRAENLKLQLDNLFDNPTGFYLRSYS